MLKFTLENLYLLKMSDNFEQENRRQMEEVSRLTRGFRPLGSDNDFVPRGELIPTQDSINQRNYVSSTMNNRRIILNRTEPTSNINKILKPNDIKNIHRK